MAIIFLCNLNLKRSKKQPIPGNSNSPVPVHEEDPLEVLELADGEVCRPHCGPALFASDAEPDVGLL